MSDNTTQQATETAVEKAAAEKATTIGEIRDRSLEELSASLDRARDELFRLKLGRFTNQLENTMKIRQKRREIARIMTVLSERRAAEKRA